MKMTLRKKSDRFYRYVEVDLTFVGPQGDEPLITAAFNIADREQWADQVERIADVLHHWNPKQVGWFILSLAEMPDNATLTIDGLVASSRFSDFDGHFVDPNGRGPGRLKLV